jgi:pyridoxine 4-dehydrogenase
MNDTVTIADDFTVKRIGLGTNRIEGNHRSQAALRKAIDIGMNFIDTAAAYTQGISEMVIGNTLAPYPENVIVATKGGMHRPDFHIDSRPEALEWQLQTSLVHLKLKQIPLYFLHRVDPHVPLTDSILFLKKMQQEGKIKYIGLSEVTVEQIKEAQAYIEISAVENEYNLIERKYEDVVDYCEQEGIVFISWFPLRRGNLPPAINSTLKRIAGNYDANPIQIALAWLLKRSPIMLPIPGSLSPVHLEENLQALQIYLSDQDFNYLSQANR